MKYEGYLRCEHKSLMELATLAPRPSLAQLLLSIYINPVFSGHYRKIFSFFAHIYSSMIFSYLVRYTAGIGRAWCINRIISCQMYPSLSKIYSSSLIQSFQYFLFKMKMYQKTIKTHWDKVYWQPHPYNISFMDTDMHMIRIWDLTRLTLK